MTDVTKLIKSSLKIHDTIKVDADLIESLDNAYPGLKWIEPSSSIHVSPQLAIASLSKSMTVKVTLHKLIPYGAEITFCLETDWVSCSYALKTDNNVLELLDLISLKGSLSKLDAIARAYPTALEVDSKLNLEGVTKYLDFEIRSCRALIIADGKIEARYLLTAVSETLGIPLNVFQTVSLTSPREFSMIKDKFDVDAIIDKTQKTITKITQQRMSDRLIAA